MKVLHIFDIAGVGAILTKYLNRHNVFSHLITDFDPFEMEAFYGCEVTEKQELSVDVIKKIVNDFGFDILHVHSVAGIVPELVPLGKPIVLHYHGSELMERKYGPLHNYAEHFAAKVLVSNKYMLEVAKPTHKLEWLPNPVDTEHFKPVAFMENAKCQRFGGWLTFEMPYTDTHEVGKFIEMSQISGNRITVSERNIPYKELPRYLQMYDGYVDAKFHKVQGLLPALSTTGLQALACGLRVLRYDGEVVVGFPLEHDPDKVATRLVQIYNDIAK